MSAENDASVDRRECPHCGLLFRFDEAKPSVKPNAVHCPYCDWEVEDA